VVVVGGVGLVEVVADIAEAVVLIGALVAVEARAAAATPTRPATAARNCRRERGGTLIGPPA